MLKLFLVLQTMERQRSTMERILPPPSKVLLIFVFAMMNLSSQNHVSAANIFRNDTDRLALLEFKHQIFDDPLGVLNSWNDSQHHCIWEGVSCDTQNQRVTALTLSGKSLFGSLSAHIGNLSFVKLLQLGENRLYDQIPQEFGNLFRLRTLNLSKNSLTGEIPVNLSRCLELRVLDMNYNSLEGKIPVELTALTKLETLYLAANNLTGEIPSSIGNLTSIKQLSFLLNQLEGSLPMEIGFLTSLSFFTVGANNLAGTIPPSIYNISTISVFTVASNFFYGELPANFGLTLPNLQECNMGGNQFSGNIPLSVTNASKLEILDLSSNQFEGQVPSNLGDLPSLQYLNIEVNLLGSNSTGDLNFIASLTNCSSLNVLSFAKNKFGGKLPIIIGNFTTELQELYMGSNQIYGSIPVELVSLTNLFILGMEKNNFTGTIPSDFGKLQKLQGLNLAVNKLSGQIPYTLFNITSLYLISLSLNSFEGTIPPSLGNCKNLKQLYFSANKLTGIISPEIFGKSFFPTVLDLSYNSLTGSLPVEVGRLTTVSVFNISYNNFSGQIPSTLGGCSSLEHLNMEGNYFTGTIPPSLASLKGIQRLDLSQNQLVGQIPGDFEELRSLKYLNLSFNDLEGEVPTKGVFENASLTTLVGNSKLCGGNPELRLHSCFAHKKKNGRLLLITLMSVLFPVILICSVLLCYCRKRDRVEESSTKHSIKDNFLRISYHELHRATTGFSSENLIGSGSFGFVYKAMLDQHKEGICAVKVLDLQRNGASKSFNAECNALRNIRHRNLVAILAYCSSIDSKGNEFKALVYEFMQNGNLDSWLHATETEVSSSGNLNLLQRLNIAVDVASALDYLQNDCKVSIAHCDLKPSNILLDNDFTARVGDFGLARLLYQTTENSSQQGTNSTIAIKGTIGYAAPEYAMGCEVSSGGDVYSYGILLLEMFTGRRPTDDMFVNGLDLHNYVKMNLLEQIMNIVDPSIQEENRGVELNDHGIEVEEIIPRTVQNCLASIFTIGLKCSVTSPRDRMKMNEVVRELHHIRDAFSAATINIVVHHT